MKLRNGKFYIPDDGSVEEDKKEFKVKYCKGGRGCKVCEQKQLDESPVFTAHLQRKDFSISEDYSCKSQNVIYLISCRCCSFQYVGRTTGPLRTRCCGHRRSLRTKKGPVHLIKHFTKVHKSSDMIIKPIETVIGNSLEEKNQREDYWIKEIGTLYPYGLNERLNKPYIDASSYLAKGNCILQLLNRPVSQRGQRGGGGSHLTKGMLFPTAVTTFECIKTAFRNDDNFRHTTKTLVNKLRKGEVCNLVKLCVENLKTVTPQGAFLYHLVLDLCRNFFQKNQPKIEKKKQRNIAFTYVNKNTTMLKLPKICNKPTVSSLYPLKEIPEFRVCHTFPSGIQHSVLNYIEVAKTHDGTSIETCNCDQSPFKNSVLGHVVTGDLKIIANRKLRNLLCKGLNHRENNDVPKEWMLKTLKNDIERHITTASQSLKISADTFTPWKETMINELEESTKRATFKKFPEKVLENYDVKEYIKTLHRDYVLVPTDKASSNTSIVCKKYYLDVLKGELENTPSYEQVQIDTAEDIMSYHENYVYHEEVDEKLRKLPYVYWLPKQHKDPPKSRFVVSGKKCTMKPLAQRISKALKTVQKCVEFRANFEFKFEPHSTFWVINNSEKVHESITRLNRNRNVKSVNTFDFSTLYTMIPHDKLLERMKIVIEMAFKISKKPFLRINRSKANWAEKLPQSTKLTYYTADGLLEDIKILLNNIYIEHGGKIFRQIIGIPIGSDCSQDLANLFLFSYENEYVRDLIANGNEDADLLGDSTRYIDDLLNLNDDGYMGRIYKDIYPEEMTLNKTNTSSSSATFLDLNINIINGKFVTTVYDKRNDFGFKVISLPHFTSNVPESSLFGVFTSQVYRMFRANSTIQGFYVNIKQLIEKLGRQGFSKKVLLYKVQQFVKNNFLKITYKYWEVVDMTLFE